MKDNETISTLNEYTPDLKVLPYPKEAPTVSTILTTSGPVRDALNRQMTEPTGEREMIWDRRYLGRWVYKED